MMASKFTDVVLLYCLILQGVESGHWTVAENIESQGKSLVKYVYVAW